jgi:hypothetical protein
VAADGRATVSRLFGRKFWAALVTGIAAGTVALLLGDEDSTAVFVTLIIGVLVAGIVGYLTPNSAPGEQAEEPPGAGRQTSTIGNVRVRFSSGSQKEAVPGWLQVTEPIVGIVTGIAGAVLGSLAL